MDTRAVPVAALDSLSEAEQRAAERLINKLGVHFHTMPKAYVQHVVSAVLYGLSSTPTMLFAVHRDIVAGEVFDYHEDIRRHVWDVFALRILYTLKNMDDLCTQCNRRPLQWIVNCKHFVSASLFCQIQAFVEFAQALLSIAEANIVTERCVKCAYHVHG